MGKLPTLNDKMGTTNYCRPDAEKKSVVFIHFLVCPQQNISTEILTPGNMTNYALPVLVAISAQDKTAVWNITFSV